MPVHCLAQFNRTRFGMVGLMICADSFMDDLIQSMKNQKPDLVLIPYGWAAIETDWPAHGQDLVKVVKHVVNTLCCPVVGTNLVGQISHGPWQGQTYGGQSVAFDPGHNILITGRDRDRDVIVFTVELNQ